MLSERRKDMSVKVHIVDGTGYDCSEVEKKINKFCKGKGFLILNIKQVFIVA